MTQPPVRNAGFLQFVVIILLIVILAGAAARMWKLI